MGGFEMRSFVSTMIVLLVLIAVGAFIISYKQRSDEDERQRIAAAVQRIRSDEKNMAEAQAAKSVRENMEKEWRDAVSLEDEFLRTGDGYDAVTLKFKTILSLYGGTQLAALAETEIERIKETREKCISQVMSDIEKKSVALSGEGRYAEAVKLCEEYSGKYQDETSDIRRKLADKYSGEEREAKIAEEKKKAYAEFRGRMLGAVAELVLSGKYKDALELMGKPGMEISPIDAEDFKSLSASLKALAGLDSAIAENLKGRIGDKIVFALKGGLDSGEISRVSGNDIYVRQNIDGKVFETKTNFHALQVQDRLKCAEGLPPQALAIYAAILYAKATNYSDAEKSLESAGLISGYLKPLILKNGSVSVDSGKKPGPDAMATGPKSERTHANPDAGKVPEPNNRDGV